MNIRLSELKVDDGFNITVINAYLSLLEDIEPKIDDIVYCHESG